MQQLAYYSQAGEDKYLYETYFCKIFKTAGTYLEMGAIDGIRYSNTKFFEDHLGWTGTLIEPNPFCYKLLEQNRPNNVNLNCLVSNNSEPLEFVYHKNINMAAFGGIKETLAQPNQEKIFESQDAWLKKMRETTMHIVKMEPRSLKSIYKQYNISQIDFFSLDVEGHEVSVLESHDWSCDVKFFLVETLTDEALNTLCEVFNEKGYAFVEKIKHNSLFASRIITDRYPEIFGNSDM